MDRCPKDEPTAENLVCKKCSSHFREKLEKAVGGGGGIHPFGPLAIRVIKSFLSEDKEVETFVYDISKLKNVCTEGVSSVEHKAKDDF